MGCRELTNVQVIDVGAVTRRPGSIYVATSPGQSCLQSFIYSESDAYILEYSHHLLRFYRGAGIVNSGVSPYTIETPYDGNDVFTLRMYQSADTAYLVSTTGAYSPRKLVRSGYTSWSLTDCNTLITDGPFRKTSATATTVEVNGVSGSVRMISSDDLFNAEHVGALWQLEQVAKKAALSGTLSGPNDSNSLPVSDGTQYSWTFTSTSFWGRVGIEVSYDDGSTWESDYTVTNVLPGSVYVDESDTAAFGQNVLLRVDTDAIFWGVTGDLDYTLTVNAHVVKGRLRITGWVDPNEVNAIVLERIGIANSPTNVWAEGAWSDYRGYPEAVTGHFSRLVFARDLTIWWSGVDNYESFDSGTNDDDAFAFTLGQSQRDPVRWILGEKSQNLYVGTLGKIIELRSLDELVGFTATNPPKVSSATVVGCGLAHPALAETAILFPDRTGRHIHELIYSYGEQTVVAPDITQIAGPILGSSGMVQMAVQRSPWPTLWCVRGDGEMASCYYNRPYEIVAWGTHNTANGLYKSVAVAPVSNELDRVWTVVKRGSAYDVEYFDDVDVDNGSLFLDSSQSYDGNDAVDVGAITKANPGHVTLDSAISTLANGLHVRIVGVLGMTQVNDKVYDVKNVNGGKTEFDLGNPDTGSNWDTASYTPYSSGGTVQIVAKTFSSGLVHLAGQTVGVVGDGVCLGSSTVSAGGSLVLSDYYNEVVIGLDYTSTVTPMEIDLYSQVGTSQPNFKRILYLLLNLYNTSGGKYGMTSTSLSAIPYGPVNSGAVSDPSERHTGSFVVGSTSGARQEATYTIVQDEAYPLTIRGLIPIFEIGN